jgi:hypothetical protein
VGSVDRRECGWRPRGTETCLGLPSERRTEHVRRQTRRPYIFIQGRAEKDHRQPIEHRLAGQVLRRGRAMLEALDPGGLLPFCRLP